MKSTICCFVIFSLFILTNCSRKVQSEGQADNIEVVELNHATSAEVVFASNPESHYAEYCASCHGAKMDAFVDRRWQYGNSHDDLFKAIKVGYIDDGMPAYAETFSDDEIHDLVNYIQEGILNLNTYSFDTKKNSSGIFQTEKLTIKLDTITTKLKRPWGITFLDKGKLLIADRTGDLYLRTPKGKMAEVKNMPEIVEIGQGGLMDLDIHPNYEENGWIYFSYTKPSIQNKRLVTTAVMRARLELDRLVDKEEIFEALPYSERRYHFGCRLEFDRQGYLYLSVGDRGNRDVNPQNLDNHCGKIHRINDDGSIPTDNPFVNTEGALPSIYTYGNRNPQGVAMNPVDGRIWENEHGPRGGDEINIIQKGMNYGWPVISYGINYNGTTFTEKTHQDGMEQPVMHWLPSIGVCGMTFVKTDRYPGWENNVLSGSLRYEYLERAVIENDEVIHIEKLFPGIGRLRVVEVGPDGYIYVGVEEPGYVFRLIPQL